MLSTVRKHKDQKKKIRINKRYKNTQRGQHYSHTSLCGVALDPRADGRRSRLVAAGHAEVVPRHSLQPGDVVLEWRRCDVDQPSHRHLSFPPTHLFDLALIRQTGDDQFAIIQLWFVQVRASPWCDISLLARNRRVRGSSSTSAYWTVSLWHEHPRLDWEVLQNTIRSLVNSNVETS